MASNLKHHKYHLNCSFGNWKELASSGEGGIYIAFSSELSGTFDTAIMIKDQVKETNPNMNLIIIDSRCASLGYGLLVKEAVRLRDAGEDDVRTIESKIRYMAAHMEHLFTVQDLDYMARGGRVSKTSAFIGGFSTLSRCFMSKAENSFQLKSTVDAKKYCAV